MTSSINSSMLNKRMFWDVRRIMRFIGSKALLLDNIEHVVNVNTTGKERIFCDLFSGTSAVARHFKPYYEVYSNDLLHFSYVIQKATIENNLKPKFPKLVAIGIVDPFKFLEETQIDTLNYSDDKNFITKHYTPHDDCERMYISNKNATRIDFIRNTIEAWKKTDLLDETEYYYLLAGLIEGVPNISNITGTYGAYLKQWDKRTFKEFEMARLDVIDNNRINKCYNKDANKLIQDLEGDILYLDPPYNSRQYAPNYHLLETISKYDYPKIQGITGMRPYEDAKSSFCVKSEVLEAFEDLIDKASFTNIILSYSTDGLMAPEQIETILKKHGLPKTYKKYEIPYRKYKSKVSKETRTLNEYLFYIKRRSDTKTTFDFVKTRAASPITPYSVKHTKYLKSPLNYIGGKHKLLPQIMPHFPNNISTFLDLFAGGCNVGINVNADRIIFNDINTKVIDMFKAFQQTDINDLLNRIEQNIKTFHLTKENEQGFLHFREHYNKTNDPVDLYTLTCYSFNYQFRFNNNLEYNNPFGRNRSQFSDSMKNNLLAFVERAKEKDIVFTNNDFTAVKLEKLAPQDMIYCDPPYLITTGTYNDGNRGFKDWKEKQEIDLYSFLDKANYRGIKFALSNVLEHKGIKNEILMDWCKKYNTIELYSDYSNSSYNTKKGDSKEVLIVNY